MHVCTNDFSVDTQQEGKRLRTYKSIARAKREEEEAAATAIVTITALQPTKEE